MDSSNFISTKKPSTRRTFWFTLINAFLAVSTIIVTFVTLSFGTVAGQVDTNVAESWFYILTFTVQSNILLGLVALVAMILGIRSLKTGKPLPRSLTTWYLVAASAAMLTAITVIIFLAPIRAIQGRNYFDMVLGPMFFFHFFNPFLSAAAFIYLTPRTKLKLKECFFALIPPAAYAVPYVLNVVILHTWYDFYGFTFGGKNWAVPVVFVVISAIIFGIASLLSFFHNKTSASAS